MSIIELARVLARGERFLVIQCTSPASQAPDESSSRGPLGEDLQALEISLDTIDDLARLQAELERQDLEDTQLIFLLPPLGMSPEFKPNDWSEITTRNLMEVLPAEKRLGTVFPMRLAFRRLFSRAINDILAERLPSTVIELPARMIYPDMRTNLSVCAVVLEPTLPTRTIFLEVSTTDNVDVVLQEYTNLDVEGGRTPHGFVLDGSIDPTKGFLPRQVDPHRELRIEESTVIGDLWRLGDLCEISRGQRRIGRGRPVTPRKKPRTGDIQVLTARMIKSGRLDESADSRWLEESAGQALQAGDIVVSEFSQPTSTLAVAELNDTDLPLLAGPDILILRPRATLGRHEALVLGRFIRSQRFLQHIMVYEGTIRRVSPQDLVDVLVPMPDPDFLNAFGAVERAAADFGGWRDEAEALLRSSLDSHDLMTARQELILRSNLIRQRSTVAHLMEDLGYRISTRYPLPVAYRWRSALAVSENSDSLQAILHAYEVLLAYLAVIAVTSARVSSIEIGYMRDMKQRLARQESGVTLGDWRGILIEVADSKAFRRLPYNAPFVDVRDYLADPTTIEASRRLNSLRNDMSHMREFGPGQRELAVRESWQDLELLFRAAEFITEYQLIQVVDTRWDDLESSNVITYKHLAGDSPIVPTTEMSVPSSTIEKGSLYLTDSKGDPHLLRPLLIGTECPTCGHWSTFHPDRLRDGGVQYKSLEHGHPLEALALARRALEDVGFVERMT